MTDPRPAYGAAELGDFMPGGAMAPAPDERVDVTGLSIAALSDLFAAMGEPAFRAKQLYKWIYVRGARDFAEMTDLSKTLRAKLEDGFRVGRPGVSAHQRSTDGTEKWLFRYADGNEAETVFIPDDERGTLCVSSQVGCSLTCSFCHTGTQRLVRNLTPGDIVGQFMKARDDLGDWERSDAGRRLTNIVFMGMGEPLYNTDNVIAALRLLGDGNGLGMGRRRITLSTSGVVPELRRIGEALAPQLAISLHAVTDELRNELVPINRKYPIAELMRAVRDYPTLKNAQRVTWEYVMLDGVNDSDADARALVRLIEGIPSKINLIPFNPWPGSAYERSSDERIRRFSRIIMDAGYASPVRTPRGQDILAACGQLKSESQRVGKRERLAMEAMRQEKEAAAGL
ncbi:23S rRNA (adenine(2503)-C(2))-methyltransferase RlmN [Marivibrio halodurans]|uniref:Dual-specificity RNA methyltransferase RlmN n=2 Tax=Marivibrio halodurans TaxID=2039722 RepID=A0A8J7V3K1_9PROT|nr:23S rRNA (adenine(2503)-C(2))-methyltransferase RlmN [Marivibrio halodurans]